MYISNNAKLVLSVMQEILDLAQAAENIPSDNWWEAGGATGCIGAYRGKGSANYDASKINLANAGTNDLSEIIGAPTWNSGGWFFSGDGKCFDTGIVIDSTNWTVFIQLISKDNSMGRMICGVYNGNTASMFIEPAWVNDNSRCSYADCDYDQSLVYRSDTSGNFCMSGQKAYFNGVDEGATLGLGSAPNGSFWIGTLNGFGGQAVSAIAAAAFYNHVLSGGEIEAVAMAMAAL